jgi:mannose-6-phosphate isomerase-like protein (cupin superfamily)
VTVLSQRGDSDGEWLKVERVMPPGTGRVSLHYHLDADQLFTIVEGQARAALGGNKLLLGRGDSFMIPRGAPHMDPWNPGPHRLVLRNRNSPPSRFVEEYIETMATRAEAGRLNRLDKLPWLQVAVIADETDAQTFDPRFPRGLQKKVLSLLAIMGGLRGYGTHRP